MKIDWTKVGIVLILALVVGGLSYIGKDAPFIAAVLGALVTAAAGFLRSPTQKDTPAVVANVETVNVTEDPKP